MKQRQILTQAKEQATQVLLDANHKANQQIRVGEIALRVMLMGAIAAGFSAWQSPKTVAANSDRSVAEVKTARLENEHLVKQSADSEQNLRVTPQQQVVNGVREQCE